MSDSTDDETRYDRLATGYFDSAQEGTEGDISTAVTYQMRDDSTPIVIHHTPRRGLAFKVWNASSVLARHLEVCGTDFRGKRAIELGAGVGLGGIVLSRLGANVVLTDLAMVLPLLEENVKANCTATVAPYCWGDDASPLNPPFDMIVGADIIYNEDIFEPLLSALLKLSDEKTVIIISYVSRWKRTNRFFRMVRKHFVVRTAGDDVTPQERLEHAEFTEKEKAVVYYLTRKATKQTGQKSVSDVSLWQ